MSSTITPEATSWKLRSRTLPFGRLPRLMGILNVTPDSFSDGGRYLEPSAAIDRALRLVDDGADLLDIGAESTRPSSTPVSVDEELRRLMPVLEALAKHVTIPISVDTSKAVIAREALATGVEVVNDVTGLEGDPEMVGVVVESGAAICVMHKRGTPQDMQLEPHYDDVLADVTDYLRSRRDALVAEGIARESICLDPGIGFGKTLGHNLALLCGAERLHDLGCPLLVGHSRKSFIGRLLAGASPDPLAGTLGVACSLAAQRVRVLRVHDVRAVKQALRLFDACGGMDRSKHD